MNARICGCGCGTPLGGMRADAVYASEACSKRARRAASPDKARTLDEVRGRGEESKEKARYTLIAREHITRTLLETGYFNAEDFDALGIPAAHVNVCTSWIGHFSKRKVMEPISWRYSSKPSRKGGKVWTYKITQKGRDKLPALLEDTRRELAGVDGDEKGVGGRSTCQLPSGASVHPGESGLTGPGSGAGAAKAQAQPGSPGPPTTGTAPPEPLSLLPETDRSTSPYDPWKDAA